MRSTVQTSCNFTFTFPSRKHLVYLETAKKRTCTRTLCCPLTSAYANKAQRATWVMWRREFAKIVLRRQWSVFVVVVVSAAYSIQLRKGGFFADTVRPRKSRRAREPVPSYACRRRRGKVQPNIAHVLFCMCWAINLSLVFFFIPRSKVYLYPGGVGGRVSSIWGSTLQSVCMHQTIKTVVG